MRVCDAPTMRRLEQHAIQEIGLPGLLLMENAGRGAAELLRRTWPAQIAGGVCVLCGRGNNGGDGYVIARHLFNAGIPVKVFYFAAREAIRGDADLNLRILEQMQLPCQGVETEPAWADIRTYALSPQVIVDALLGTGINSNVSGLLLRVIEDTNAACRHVFAVDIPSGLDASTGRVMGAAIKAEVTASFGLAKLGQVIGAGLDHVGRLEVIDISLPRSAAALETSCDRLVTAPEIVALLPRRPRSGHKGTFGHVIMVAGSVGKVGAAIMACHAALRSGCGLVTLALPRAASSYLSSLWPEVMLELLEDNGSGHLEPASLPHLLSLAATRDALAMGPGLSTASGVGETLLELLRQIDKPVVLDADALNVLAGCGDELRAVRSPLILTPHPGEAGRLMTISTEAVQRDRAGAVRSLARRYGATVVLKGAQSLTATPEGRLSINTTGNPGMGTGGAGDVLTGLMGGLLAQGLGAEDAAVTAVYIHGLAGDLVAREQGERAMIAGDIIAHLGAAYKQVLGSDA